VDVEPELACRVVAALRKAGHRPLRVAGVAETVRAVDQLRDSIAMLITGGDPGTRALLARIAPRTRVLNIAQNGLDITRLPDEGWAHLVQAVLDEPA